MPLTDLQCKNKLICCVLILLVANVEPALACMVSEEYKRAHFAEIDLDKNGQLSFDEFFKSNQETGASEDFKQQQKAFFSELDHDHSGQLSSDEYNSVAHVKCL